MPDYGVCKALDGQKVQGTDQVLAANPLCVCVTPMQAMICMTGHMLECHYPFTCAAAHCGHWEVSGHLERDDQ